MLYCAVKIFYMPGVVFRDKLFSAIIDQEMIEKNETHSMKFLPVGVSQRQQTAFDDVK